MKTKLFAAVALGAMVATAGSAFAMSLQNDRAHDGGPRSFNDSISSGGQNLVLPQIGVTGSAQGVYVQSGGYSLQNERDHDGRFK